MQRRRPRPQTPEWLPPNRFQTVWEAKFGWRQLPSRWRQPIQLGRRAMAFKQPTLQLSSLTLARRLLPLLVAATLAAQVAMPKPPTSEASPVRPQKRAKMGATLAVGASSGIGSGCQRCARLEAPALQVATRTTPADARGPVCSCRSQQQQQHRRPANRKSAASNRPALDDCWASLAASVVRARARAHASLARRPIKPILARLLG